MAFSLPAEITRGLPADGPTASVPWTPGVAAKAQRAVMSAMGGVSASVVRRINRKPLRRDGQQLDPHFQLGVAVIDKMGHPELSVEGLPGSREHTVADAYTVSGTPAELPVVKDISLPVRDGRTLGARYYRPTESAEPLPLLVYFHGGGWVHGNLDSHDATCRYLAHRGELAVLAIDYRLAPEDPFPAAVHDAVDAFTWAVERASDLGVDPAKVAVGGDSAGGNLSAVVALATRDTDGPKPAFQLLFVPVTDLAGRTRSYRLFGEGLYLTAAEMDFFQEQYVGDADPADPLVSPFRAGDLAGLPPAHVAVAGFDPLRDEGEAYARRLQQAGVPTSLRRHSDVVHPFVNALGASARARAAMDEAIGALRQGLQH